jgi:hypothetical protein
MDTTLMCGCVKVNDVRAVPTFNNAPTSVDAVFAVGSEPPPPHTHTFAQ